MRASEGRGDRTCCKWKLMGNLCCFLGRGPAAAMHFSSATRIFAQLAWLLAFVSRHAMKPTSSGPHGGALPRVTFTVMSSSDTFPKPPIVTDFERGCCTMEKTIEEAGAELAWRRA